MENLFWLLAIIIAAWFFFIRGSSKTKALKGHEALNEAEPWLSKNGISLSSVVFHYYEEKGLARNPGAGVLVGFGSKQEGGEVGFALEITKGHGVIDSAIIVPYAFARYHRTASMKAKAVGFPLMDILLEMATKHRESNP